LVFARNERPSADATFYFVTVEHEESLNRRGRLRVDAKAARVVSNTSVQAEPELLKTLFRGTTLDVALIKKLRSAAPLPLVEYWKRHHLEHGDGFQVGGAAGLQQSAADLHGLPVLTDDDAPVGYNVRTSGLPVFSRPKLLRPRRRDLYRAPIVLISQAPDMTRRTPRASIVKKDLAFTESFIGYSCAGHDDADALARYLFLLFNSNIPIYVALMTSGQFGVERDVYLLDDIKQQPFRPIEELTLQQRGAMIHLADELLGNHEVRWEQIDEWAADVYGLNKWDREVISDALRSSSPSSESRAFAQARPTRATIASFSTRLATELRPFLREAGTSNAPVVTSHSADDQWIWLTIAAKGTATLAESGDLVTVADDLGSTQVFVCQPGMLHIGILGQNRYWTRTRARLLALDLLQREDMFRALTTPDA